MNQNDIRVVLLALRDRVSHQNHLYRVHKIKHAKEKANEALRILKAIEKETGIALEAVGGSAALAATMPPPAP